MQVAALTPTQWADAKFTGVVTGVAIAGAPVVSFKVTDAAGNPVVGLGSTSKSATAKFASYPNLAFALAKLVPGANGSASQWVNYAVTSVETSTAAVTAARPSTDSTGTLVDNGDGTYKYTFYRDITKAKDVVAGLTLASPNVAADLGDLTYSPSLTHRLVIQLSGNAPGTGSNTANAVTVTPGFAMKNPINMVYDFVPATGQVVTAADAQREIVATAKCNECHDQIGVTTPHGGRIDTRYCVTCHTDQRKFGRTVSTSVAGAFTGTTYVADGAVSGDFTTMIHKVHMGNRLSKTGYDYAGVKFDKVAYTQEVTNCTKCHDNSATSTAKTTQGDNWKQAPSITACGSCHDGINFATGVGHASGFAARDQDCATCHKPIGLSDIAVAHAGINKTPNNLTVPAGLTNFTYDVKTVTVNASNQPVVTFRVMKQTAPEAAATPVVFDGTSVNPLVGFTGGPSFLVGYAGEQDGVKPVDFNNFGKKRAQPASVTIGSLLATLGTPVDGYYTVAFPAGSFPVGAKLRTIALQGYFTQAAGTNGIAAITARHTLSSVKAVAGEERRAIIDSNKCGSCHEVFEGHGGNRNVGLGTVGATSVCVICHNPGLVTSGRGTPDSVLKNFPYTAASLATLTSWGIDKDAVNGALDFPQITQNLKDMIHGIHAGKARTNPIQIARFRPSNNVTLINGADIKFVGILKNCQNCHTAGSYSSVPANSLVSTEQAINGLPTTSVADVLVALDTHNQTDLVTTPFTAACASCHDAAPAIAHMKTFGGQILVARSLAIPAGESCTVCHATGRANDTAVAHTK